MNPGNHFKKLDDAAVWNILKRLWYIDHNNPNKDTQVQIAADFQVQRKTISRIHNGRAWPKIKAQFDAEHNRKDEISPIAFVYTFTPGEHKLCATIESIKTALCLNPKKPIDYGQYDWYDGVRSVVTDGTIMWDGGMRVWDKQTLFDFARIVERSAVNVEPCFANKVSELPTSVVGELMTRPPGDFYELFEEFPEGVTSYRSRSGHKVFIHDSFKPLITAQNLKIYQAGKTLDCVYLVKPLPNREDNPFVIACLATMRI